jgi:predicted NAD/FAD-dependent oxidoreductase
MQSIRYNKHKFRELVVLLAQRSADDPWFGDTKLNKQLHFCDFGAYRKLGRPMTGAPYQRDKHGPTARPLIPVREELEDEGVVKVEQRPVGAHKRRVTVPLRDADLSLFSAEELAIVDEVVKKLKRSTASRVADVAHDESAGWNLVHQHEDIPYVTALIDTEPPSGQTLEHLRGIAVQRGW